MAKKRTINCLYKDLYKKKQVKNLVGGPDGGFGGPGGGFRTGRSSGKPLLLQVLKKTLPGPPKPPPGPPKRKIIGGALRKPYINSLYTVF